MRHKNFRVLDQSIIDAMCARYRTGFSVTDLMSEFGLGRNKVVKTLKEALGSDYITCACLARASVGQKVAPKLRGRKNPHTPEWNAKIAAAHIGLGHSEETKALISQRMKERELDPGWQARKEEISVKIVEGKRARGYFKIHAQRHSELMRARELESGIMGQRSKKSWREGKFTYGGGAVMRSKLEKRVYADVLARHPDATHSYSLVTNERTYCYDIHVPSLNLLIEVNGDFWHCDPRLMSEADWKQVRDVDAVRAKDVDKIRVAAANGYRVVTMWEDELATVEDACDLLEPS